MAGSISATAASLIAVGVAAAAGIAGGVMQSNAAEDAAKRQADQYKQQADYQQKVDQYNATVAKNNADTSNQQASAEEDFQRRKAAMVQGEAAAAIAQNNVGFLGSSEDVLRQNAINAELDALNIRYEGRLKSDGLMAQAGLSQWNGDQAISSGNVMAANSLAAGKTNSAAALLSGVSSAFGSAGTAAYYARGYKPNA